MSTIIDIKKAYYASHWYENEHGHRCKNKPAVPTVCGSLIQSPHEYSYPPNHDFPLETIEEKAKRLGMIDTWMPVVEFTFGSRQIVTYKGKKAITLWLAWNKRVFNSSKAKKKE